MIEPVKSGHRVIVPDGLRDLNHVAGEVADSPVWVRQALRWRAQFLSDSPVRGCQFFFYVSQAYSSKTPVAHGMRSDGQAGGGHLSGALPREKRTARELDCFIQDSGNDKERRCETMFIQDFADDCRRLKSNCYSARIESRPLNQSLRHIGQCHHRVMIGQKPHMRPEVVCLHCKRILRPVCYLVVSQDPEAFSKGPTPPAHKAVTGKR